MKTNPSDIRLHTITDKYDVSETDYLIKYSFIEGKQMTLESFMATKIEEILHKYYETFPDNQIIKAPFEYMQIGPDYVLVGEISALKH